MVAYISDVATSNALLHVTGGLLRSILTNLEDEVKPLAMLAATARSAGLPALRIATR